MKQVVPAGLVTAHKAGTVSFSAAWEPRSVTSDAFGAIEIVLPRGRGNFAATDFQGYIKQGWMLLSVHPEALAFQDRSQIMPSLSAAHMLRGEGEGWRRCPSRLVGLTAVPQAPPPPHPSM